VVAAGLADPVAAAGHRLAVLDPCRRNCRVESTIPRFGKECADCLVVKAASRGAVTMAAIGSDERQ
jgi:hypothetical protein